MSDYAYMFQKRNIEKTESTTETILTGMLTLVMMAIFTAIILLVPFALK